MCEVYKLLKIKASLIHIEAFIYYIKKLRTASVYLHFTFYRVKCMIDILAVSKKYMAEEICNTCKGTRLVSAMERVYPGEPHMADIGEQPCPDCREEEDYDPDE